MLAPLAVALADYVDGAFARAADALAALRPTMYRWGGSRAQREVVEDMLIDAAIRGGRFQLATRVLTERVERRPSRWDTATLRSLTAGMWQAVPDDLPGHH
jgi:Flp pilus assembly protein TadD